MSVERRASVQGPRRDRAEIPDDFVRIRRSPKRAVYRRALIEAIIDDVPYAHVAFATEGRTICIPMLHARHGRDLLIHGSQKSRAMRTLAGGAQACVTITSLDGLVLARSAFEHSANYRSAIAVGTFRAITDPDDRLSAFEAFTNKLMPGRWAEVRHPNERELKATMILAMDITTASAKVRAGPPDDDETADAELDVWAGVLPLRQIRGDPQPSPGLRPGIRPPRVVTR